MQETLKKKQRFDTINHMVATKLKPAYRQDLRDKNGQRKGKVSKEAVRDLAVIGCTDAEIQRILGVGNEKFEKHRETVNEARANLNRSIKRTQLEVALKNKDRAMLIWVGKQYCGQRDKTEAEVHGDVNLEVSLFAPQAKPFIDK